MNPEVAHANKQVELQFCSSSRNQLIQNECCTSFSGRNTVQFFVSLVCRFFNEFTYSHTLNKYCYTWNPIHFHCIFRTQSMCFYGLVLLMTLIVVGPFDDDYLATVSIRRHILLSYQFHWQNNCVLNGCNASDIFHFMCTLMVVISVICVWLLLKFIPFTTPPHSYIWIGICALWVLSLQNNFWSFVMPHNTMIYIRL